MSYTVKYDAPEQIDVEFSTVSQTWSGLRDVSEIIKSAQSTASSITAISQQLDKNMDTYTAVKKWVSNGLELTNQMIMSDANNQSLLIDEHGLLARKYYDLTDTYDDCQLKIFNNGLYTTHDGWKTINAGVGKFIWKNPENNWKEEETYGIIAKKIVGEQILGEDLKIVSGNGSVSITGDGIIIKNGMIYMKHPDDGRSVTINPIGIDPENPKNTIDNSYIFAVTDIKGNITIGTDSKGNAYFAGNIKSGSTITGSTITGSTISTTNNIFSVDEDGTTTVKDLIVTDSIYGQYLYFGEKLGIAKVMEFIMTPNYKYENYFYDEHFGDGGFGSFSGSTSFSPEVSSIKFCSNVSLFDSFVKFNKLVDFQYNTSFNATAVFNEGAVIKKALRVYGNIVADNIDVKYLKSDIVYDATCNKYYTCELKYTNFIPGEIVSISNDTTSSTNADGIINLGDPEHRWNNIYSINDIIQTSDYNQKDNIKSLTQQHIDFFIKLIPVSFTFKDGTSGRIHIGFISQDVEKAMMEAGLTDIDFAGFCKDIKTACRRNDDGTETEIPVLDKYGNPEYVYSLRYTEFIALITFVLQDTIKKLDNTNKEILELNDKYNKITSYIGYREII